MKYHKFLGCAVATAAFVVEAGIATADFTKDVGPVRPELHPSRFGFCGLVSATPAGMWTGVRREKETR